MDMSEIINKDVCLKTFSAVFFFLIDFFYIYVYCRKFNAEFNKLIKTVGFLRQSC